MNKLNKQAVLFKLAALACLIATALASAAYANEYFNPELIELDNPGMKGADLSAFEAGSQLPGTYRVDVLIGGQIVDTREIKFDAVKNAEGETILQPCLSVAQLNSWGIKTGLFPDLASGGECAKLSAIPQASTELVFTVQQLAIGIPQAALSAQARGYVPPEMWDEGIAAALLNYSLSGSNNWGHGSNANSLYANLRSGINVGPWRIRNYATWTRDSNGNRKWDNVYVYAQRAIVPLKAQLTTGDGASQADVYDSIPFRGVQLASDDDMMPDSLKGYAPVVRGIARTNAQVIIHQNGYQIYQSDVAPGAFEITDIYPTGSAGDLDVTVKESDGSEQRFSVAFASLPVLQREGRFKFAITGGQYRSTNNDADQTLFSQLTGIYGLPYGLTLYGGLQESSKYHSLAAGMGKNLGDFGAFSTDVTQAWSTSQNMQRNSGQSWRIRYSKNFVGTGTHFAIAGYRYSTSGYYGMQEVLDNYSDNSALQNRRRNRAELTMSQNIGQNLGALTLSAVREDYWNSDKTIASYSAVYNNAWQSVNYGITYTFSKNGSTDSYSRTTRYGKDRQIALSVSIPLEAFLPRTWVNYSINASKNNGTTHSVGLNGTALENNALSWNVQQGHGTDAVGYTGNASVDFKGTYGEAYAGYGYDKGSDRLNYGLQGGIIAHADGVTFSQPLGETSVLVKAPGAVGVSIQNQSGAKTDWRGYTAVSNLTPYRKNDVALRTDTLPDDVELELTNKTVIPTRGAVVRADYVAKVGMRVLMTLHHSGGEPVPFGAIATATNSESSFIVGDKGQVYLTGLSPNGTLLVKWGNEDSEQCRVNYRINEKDKFTAISVVAFNCS
ncbi:fimbrial biogenesis outer membrane usher protein [Enterobacter cloacae complex sp. P40RS]|uniref:Fimbrial biogenesis outer membrane usher protein n=1 Tax=Enterobacter pasteurii TaxID=3029761 RepID=A0ABR9Q1Z5_9ENTR|nr:fimbrial biogenesis outer membrane usher protein [Enterobacter pasteurii]MBE4861928.1 fimbrial biogenesis outer membrane usher protein [Enterobacter cloacae complex sp. P40C2]MBE4877888.1 fimbrial biogenesis outer membrane usher protein [Enterobacter cloacae complex sp. P40C]